MIKAPVNQKSESPPKAKLRVWLRRAALLAVGAMTLAYFGGKMCPVSHQPTARQVEPPAVPTGAPSPQRCVHQMVGGNKHTVCHGYFRNGQLRKTFRLVNGLAHGLKETYYYNGQIRQKYNFVNGRLQGSYINYYENGDLSYRFSAPSDSPVHSAEFFYPSGELWFTAEFADRRHHGPLTIYDRNGEIIREIATTRNVFYDNAGRPLQGELTIQYADGRPMFVCRFRDGRLHGDRELYFPDGTLFSRYHFVNGVFQNKGYEHYLDGSLRVIKYYKDHNLIYEQEFDPAGTKIFESGQRPPPPVPEPDDSRAVADTPYRT